MMRPRNIYFVGTALLTAAAAVGSGLSAALTAAGLALVIYGFATSVEW